MSIKRRSSFESGHQRKYLVVIDDTKECDRAVYWAAKRAARTKSGVVMLRVIETEGRNQQWLGVADIMKQEAQDEANVELEKYAGRANGIGGITPERVVREGVTSEEIAKLIEEDADIGILVLGAGTETEGPGPLVASIAKFAGTFPIPLAIVPGHLSDEELDAMS
jgi:nucleotide-binding universal stress UspA family protein